MVDAEWLSPTRVTGLADYGAGFLACAARWANCRKKRVPGMPFVLLAAVQLCLLLDMAFDWRWKIHDFWMRNALAHGAYDQRRVPQALAVGILALGVLVGGGFILVRFRRRIGLAMAFSGTLLSAGLWCCEWVSFHMIDQVFYHRVGNVMAVSLLWTCLALVTCFGVWLDGRSPESLQSRWRSLGD
jgi:hypothetical protein